jgi:hypothetical protein
MSVTICRRGSDQETTTIPAEALLATRAVDFEELFGELVEEAGRALKEGDEGWCAMLQEYLIPKIEAETLRLSQARAKMLYVLGRRQGVRG